MKKATFSLLTTLGGLIILTACHNDHSGSAASVDKPTHYVIPDSVKVPYKEAKHLVDNYGPHAGTVERGDESFPNTRAIWFELERLEALVAQIRKEGGDGIRFYLATYDNSYPGDAQGGHVPPRPYWGHNTLLMVSTKDSTTANGQTVHRDYYTESNAKGYGFMLRAEAENLGKICPPPFNCFDEGALLLENQ